MSTPPDVQRVRVWDGALRVFHWALAACVAGGWIIAQLDPKRWTGHFLFGYIVAGLLVFRLLWGLVGPQHARFSGFLAGPGAAFSYARHMFDRAPSYWAGHNPLGAWSVVAMLVSLVVQVVTGMMSESENFIDHGPLSPLVSSAMRKQARSIHEANSNILLVLVILHVAVIAFYLIWKRENLVRPMITGWKLVRRR